MSTASYLHMPLNCLRVYSADDFVDLAAQKWDEYYHGEFIPSWLRL